MDALRRLLAAFLLLASPAAAELDLDGVELSGGTLHMQARITAGGHTRTNDQHNIWSGSAWTADTPTGTLDEGSMQLTGHAGNEPVIRRVARWPSTSPNTSTNRLILNSVGGDADGIMDYFSASAGLTIIHEDSAGTITQASTQGAPSGMNNSFVDWRDDGGNPLGDEMWALINSVVAGDSLILVAHAGGTVTYTQPAEPTWAGKYNGVAIDEGKYNGATITAAKFNGVDIITGTSTPVTPITGVVVDAGADQTVASGSTTQINATVTLTNPSGTTTYAWTRQSGTGGSLSSTTVEDPSFTAPTLSAADPQRQITWRLTATNNGVSESDDITFTVTPPVTTVSVAAGADQTIDSGDTATINATVTVTNGAGATTYAWTRVSGTGGSLSSTTVEDPTFTAPTLTAGDPDRVITWRLTATNNSVSDSDDIAFTVEAPAVTTTVTVDAGHDHIVTSASTTDIDATVTVTNGVGTTTFAWTRVSGTGGSLSSGIVEDPTFTAPTLSPGDAARTIEWRLTATNNSVSASDDVSFLVEILPQDHVYINGIPLIVEDLGGGEWRVHSDGNFPSNSGYEIPASLMDGGSAEFLRAVEFRSDTTDSHLRTRTTDDVSDTNGGDLTRSFEEYEFGIRLHGGGNTVIWPSPDYTGNPIQDGSEPYGFRPQSAERTALRTLLSGIGAGTHTFSITLRERPANTVTFTGVTLQVTYTPPGVTEALIRGTGNTSGDFTDNTGYSVPDSLRPSGATGDAFFRRFALYTSTTLSRVSFESTDTGGGSGNGPDLSIAWEDSPGAITISRGTNSITLPGPDNSSNLIEDSSDPYVFRLSQSDRDDLRTFLTAVGEGTHSDFTITLSDTDHD